MPTRNLYLLCALGAALIVSTSQVAIAQPDASNTTVAVTDDALPYLSGQPRSPPDLGAIDTKPRTPVMPSWDGDVGDEEGAADFPHDALNLQPSATSGWDKNQSSPVTGKAVSTRTRLTFDDSRVPGMLTPTNAVGKLFMCSAASGSTCTAAWVCSGTLVGKGLVITAAHCVWDYGKAPSFVKINGAIAVWFYPALNGNDHPYGAFRAKAIRVPAPYANGKDTCASKSRGVACNNDVALIVLDRGGRDPANPVLAGDAVGSYMGIGVNNYGFGTPTNAGVSPGVVAVFGNKPSAQVAQLGYPAGIDGGSVMQASFSPAHVWTASGTRVTTTTKKLRQLVKATTMGGGASGGPWVVNLGVNGAGAVYGDAAAKNVIVGVSSWGFINSLADINAFAMFGCSTLGVNAEFPAANYGSRFGGNIGMLLYDTCDVLIAGEAQTFAAQGVCP